MSKTRRLLYEHLCFHAQQAAEKALKAVLVHHGIRVPRSHDMAYLMSILPESVGVPPTLIELPDLTKYAVQQLYPGEPFPLTAKHRRRALELAEQAIARATRVVR
jgi:HEPN domain-containing protein